MFSKRTDWSLTPNPLIARLDALKKEKINIVDLTESNPTHCSFAYPVKKILSPLASIQNMTYQPTCLGLREARQAVSLYYKKRGYGVDIDHIALTASTSEAYSFLFRLLTNPGERILAPKPSYPLFEFLAQLNDLHLDYYPLVYDKNWHIDLKELKQAIKPQTRLMILVNPNNPTGSFVKKEELIEINQICKEHNMAIICDEVFLDFAFSPKKTYVSSLAQNEAVLTFTLGGASKSLGLPQMKIAWIVLSGPEMNVKQAMSRLEIILDTYLSVNTPSLNALSKWLALQGPIRKDITKRLKQNDEFIRESLSLFLECEYLQSEGGWYAIVRLPSNLSEDEWALKFLEKDHIFVHPGYFFDLEGGTFIVLSLLQPVPVFQKAFKSILKRVRQEIS